MALVLPEGGNEIENIWHIKFENGRSNLILSGQFWDMISGPAI